jgi:hypothetical protein
VVVPSWPARGYAVGTSGWRFGPGSAVACELAARELRMRAVTRGGAGDVPGGVEQVAADDGAAEVARRACEGRRPRGS